MNAVNAYYDGRVFVSTEPVRAKRNQNAVITILDEETKEKPHLRFICLPDSIIYGVAVNPPLTIYIETRSIFNYA